MKLDRGSINQIMHKFGTVMAALIIIIGFSILSPDSFATIGNIINISRQISFLVIIAIGATMVMAVGEFDLSVGAVASFAGVMAAVLAVKGFPIWAAFLLSIAAGFIIGFINGWIVTKFKVLSFITTMAMGTILEGFTFKITGGATIFENIPKSFGFFGQSNLLGIPLLSVIMLFVAIVFWFVMADTSFGRRVYAIGGNETASRVAGVNTSMYKNIAFGLCSALAALTGTLMASRLGSAHPTGGDGLFLPSYAAAYLGMTAFKSGVPNIWGTFVGASIIGILANGLTILEVPTYMQDVITGIIVIAAVIIQKVGRK